VTLKKNSVRVIITAGPIIKLCAGGGRGTVKELCLRYDEPRNVWTSLPITH
jgi:hypothetical protein